MGIVVDGRYQVIRKIGEGGMGAVYLAQDQRLKRQVAVKRLVFQGKPDHEEVFRRRFEREALTMAGFQHPNIVSVYDFGQDDEGVYLVLEYMSGGSLAQRMRHFSVEEAVSFILPLTDALQEIHAMGQVHRDIKPSNILFDRYSNPKLADFGVVKLLETESEHTLTATGAAVGTPSYMAPELIGGDASPLTDQYALGVVLYEMVTGKKPFQGRTPLETLTMQKYEPLPDPHSIDSELPDWICEVLTTVLAKEPQERYADVPAFAEVLRNEGADEDEKVEPINDLAETGKTLIIEPGVLEEFIDELESTDDEETEDSLQVYQLEESPSEPVENQQVEKKKFPLWIAVLAIIILIGGAIGFGGKLFVPEVEAVVPVAELATTEVLTSTLTSTMIPTSTNTLISTEVITHTATATALKTSTPTASPTAIYSIGTTMTREMDGMEMVYIPAGSFLMGNDNGNINEQPQHTVFLDGYWIDKYEVTNAQYARFLNSVGGNQTTKGYWWVKANDEGVQIYESETGVWQSFYGVSKYPMIEVSWYGAMAYCEWTGGSLPTEAQWEKAARGTDGNTYPWGQVWPNCSLLNYSGCVDKTTSVGSYPNGASLYGTLDMAGNVAEWVVDRYDENFYEISPAENPTGPESGGYRVIRGGSWNNIEDHIQTGFRSWYLPYYTYNYLGFRCVSTP